jgi:hypothetical protein
VQQIRLTIAQDLPPQDIGRGPLQVALDAVGMPLLWRAKRIDSSYYLPGVYRFLRFDDGIVDELPIPPLTGSHPRLCPFEDGRLLVVFTSTDRERLRENAFVFDADGVRLASFRTADAVADVQITAAGDIWVSYFDESAEGELECFDQHGRQLFTYRALREQHSLPVVVDCYALNVSSDMDTWLYYYAEFPLVRLVNHRLAGQWDASMVPGATAMAVDGHRVLFAGRHDRPNGLFLFDLQSGTVEECQPVYEDGGIASLAGSHWIGRGSRLYVYDALRLYTIDLAELR